MPDSCTNGLASQLCTTARADHPVNSLCRNGSRAVRFDLASDRCGDPTGRAARLAGARSILIARVVAGPEVLRDSDVPPGWGACARRLGSFYHHPRWVEGLRSTFGYRLHYLTVRAEDGIVGGLPLAEVPALFGPRRLVSLPFSYAAGVMAESAPVASALMHAARELAAELGVKRVEVKQARAGLDLFDGFARVAKYATYLVSTEGGADAVWRRLHGGGTQRSIRKGQKAGVSAAAVDSAESWTCMAELQEQTSHRLGLPPPPRRFFEKLCPTLQAAGLADLVLAVTREGAVASGVVIWKGERSWIYAFGASRQDLLELRPNHVALWEALRRACDAGVGFDLGRATREQKGLVEFKQRWGGEELPLAYDYWPGAAGLNVAARDEGALVIASRVWSRLPASAARRGSFLYRYLG